MILSKHPDLPSRQLEISGSTMNVIDCGDGPPVVLGCSYLWDARMWRPQIDAMAGRYRVIVPELWGHGGSGPMPPNTIDMRCLARQHLSAFDQLGLDRFAMIGLSVGGMWGAEMALMAPDRISALALLDTSLAAEPEPSRLKYFALLDAIERSGALPDAVRNVVVPLFFSASVRRRHPDLPDGFDAALRAWDPARLVDSVVPLGRIIFGRREALPDLAELAMPALVMTGSDDLARAPDEGRSMAAWLRCAFVEIPEAGHIATLEAPAFVTAALERFLERSA